jgi:hypothetical protein
LRYTNELFISLKFIEASYNKDQTVFTVKSIFDIISVGNRVSPFGQTAAVPETNNTPP